VKIRIDADACTGHGRCYSLSPALFEPDDEGFGQVIVEDVPAGQEADGEKAAANCPERAVHVEL